MKVHKSSFLTLKHSLRLGITRRSLFPALPLLVRGTLHGFGWTVIPATDCLRVERETPFAGFTNLRPTPVTPGPELPPQASTPKAKTSNAEKIILL